MSEYINGTTDILGGSVIRYALNTTTPNQAVIRKIIAGNGISITSTGVDAGTGDVTISIDTSGTGGSGGGTGGGGGTPTAVGTVTSVNMTAPEGMFVLGAPITTAGTIALRLSSGYIIPLYVDVQEGKTAFSWGNHALAGYQLALSGTGLVKSVGGVISYVTDNSANWNTAYGWGNHTSAGYLTAESDTLNTVTGRGNITTNLITVGGITATGVTSTIYAGTATRLRTEANNLVFERESSSGFMKIYINQTTLAATAKSYFGYNNATLNTVLSNEHTSGGLELRTQDIIRQQIFTNGNIVIGAVSPVDAGYKFDVAGTVRSQGAFLANSTSRFENTMSAFYLATPAAPTAIVSSTGGTMADGTYYYKIVAQDGNGGLTLPSTELAVVVSAGTGTASVALSWAQTPNAYGWRVYKGTASNAQDRWFSVFPITYTDTGSAGTLGTVPTINTSAVYQVTSTTFHVNTQLTFSGRGNGIRLVDSTNALQQIIIGSLNTTVPYLGTGRIAIGHSNTSNSAVNYVMQIGYSNVATSSTSAITIQIGFGNTIGANAGTLYPLLIGGNNNFSPTALLGGFPSGFLIGTGNSTTYALSSIMGWNNIATAENQLIFGYSQTNTSIGGYTDVYFGNGVRSRNQDLIGKAVTINSSGAGEGTDKAGGHLILAGGKGTGTGTPGDVIISTASVLTTGSTLQSLTQRLKVNATTGAVTIINLAGTGDRFVIANSSGVLATATIGSGLSYSGGVLSATGGAAGTVTGSGTAGKIVKFNSASDIGDSIMTESSSLITVAGSVNATSFVKSGGTSSQYLMADGSVTTNTFLMPGSFVSDYDSDITGLRNSSNLVYTLSQNYQSGTTKVYVNGVRYSPGAGNDYTESAANQITFTNAPDAGDLILVDYIKS